MNARIILTIFIFYLAGCSDNNSDLNGFSERKNHQDTLIYASHPNYSIALDFINSYVKFCDNRDVKILRESWLKEQKITSSFMISYDELVTKNEKLDPEFILDFDPIFDAQDYPDKGFEIYKIDSINHTVVLQGVEWTEFKLLIKLNEENKQWLVDGVGAINK